MLGYFLTGMTYSVIFSSVGIISLAGVVVNNAISYHYGIGTHPTSDGYQLQLLLPHH